MADPMSPFCLHGPVLARHGLALAKLSLVLAGLSLAATPALAGSITADTVMDKSGARQAAMSQVPRGATITRTRCQEIEIGLDNIRYRCTVWYTEPPLAPAMTTPVPAPRTSPVPTPAPNSPQPATPGS